MTDIVTHNDRIATIGMDLGKRRPNGPLQEVSDVCSAAGDEFIARDQIAACDRMMDQLVAALTA
jgi:hypothetical protein